MQMQAAGAGARSSRSPTPDNDARHGIAWGKVGSSVWLRVMYGAMLLGQCKRKGRTAHVDRGIRLRYVPCCEDGSFYYGTCTPLREKRSGVDELVGG
jgi:hypothetical protein